jgi:hypothetical protein
MSISSIAANAIHNTPLATSAAAQCSFPTTPANASTAAATTAATGSSDPFLGLSAELQSMLVQLQGGAATPDAPATAATATPTQTTGTATTNAANLSQTLSTDMQQALQAYASNASSSEVPTIGF